MDFIYTEDCTAYEDVLKQKIVDCRSKHVMALGSEKAKSVYYESKNIGYDKALWGYGSGLYKNPSLNRDFQLHSIGRMIYKGFDRPFRIVIDTFGTVWIDNLHSAIRDVLVYGEDVTLGQTRCYIVDMHEETPIVVNINNIVSTNINDIKGCIESSYARCNRASQKLQDINYTIKEFMRENDIRRATVNIDEKYFDIYKRGRKCGV